MRIYKKPVIKVSIFDNDVLTTASSGTDTPVVTPEPEVQRTSAIIEMNKAMRKGNSTNYVGGSLME